MDLALSLSAIIAVIWGLFPFALKYASTASSSTTPAHILLLALSFVWFLCALAYSTWRAHRSSGSPREIFADLRRIGPRALLVIALAAFLGLFVKNILYLYVIETSSEHLNVALAVMSLSSLVSLLFAALVLKVALSTQAVVGIGLTAIGVATMLHATTVSPPKVALIV